MGVAVSTPRAVRLPNDLDDAVMSACGGPAEFSEWARNVFRRAVGHKLDFAAGYHEGKMKGWSDASTEFKAAMAKTQKVL
jgi:hypothetical protein